MSLGPPTLPAASDIAPWSDNDAGVPPGPVPAFRTNPSGKADDQMPTIGHIGRYALKYKIGAGGLGTVYAAHDPLLSRLIAIKTLNLEIAPEEREAFNALFLNEARAAGGLSHPHIVTVFDAGVADHSAYIAMELLKGRDLRQLRQEGWRPTPVQAATIVRRVADALAYAHSKGVIHRDIKPANIFMVGRTQPRVLDFGIARIAHQHDGAGDIAAGSPYYMAPEQVRQQPVDRRADVFSLGVVLYELLADRRPFTGGTLAEINTAVLEHKPPRADEVDPAVPAALAEIAARAMEKDPEHRYRSARTLSRELRHWLDENTQPNAPDSVPPDLAAAAPQRRRRVQAAAAGLVIGLLAGLGWLMLRDAPAERIQVVAPAPLPATPPAAGPAPEATVVAAATPAAEAASPAHPVPAAASAAEAPRPAAKTAPTRTASAKTPVRETRAKEAHPTPSANATGSVRIAVSPWGNVEVNGAQVGITPPLNELTLPEGRYQIVIRNADFPPYSATVSVAPGQPVNLKHKFGS